MVGAACCRLWLRSGRDVGSAIEEFGCAGGVIMPGAMELIDVTNVLKGLRTHIAQSFKVPYKQLPRVFFHGIILAMIIAGFWLLDSLKDPVIASTIGIEYQPLAKLLSVLTTLVIVFFYDILTSLVSKPALFHLISFFFGILTMILSALVADPVHGLGHEKGPHRILGWFAFCAIEAYGSLMVALFWSFTNSIMNLEQAKGAYGLIIAVAQIGAIIGSTLATNASYFGISTLFLIGSMMIFSISLLIKMYHLTFRDEATESVKARVRSVSESSTDVLHALPHYALSPLTDLDRGERERDRERGDRDRGEESDTDGDSDGLLGTGRSGGGMRGGGVGGRTMNLEFDSEDEVEVTSYTPPIKPTLRQSCLGLLWGFAEGLALLFRYPYMIKLLGVSCLYEVVVTILDYQFKVMGSSSVQASVHSLTPAGSVEAGNRFAQLLGHFGQFTNILSFLLSFFGFSYLVHQMGVPRALLIFPTTLFMAVVVTNLVPSMWVLFVMVSIMKAVIFSLHDPVKELLYIPTSEAIKYKAKAWIDVFGARLAKAIGSTICTVAGKGMGASASQVRRTAEIPSLLIAALIVGITWSIGADFTALIESNTIVGSDLVEKRAGGKGNKGRGGGEGKGRGLGKGMGGGMGGGAGKGGDEEGTYELELDGPAVQMVSLPHGSRGGGGGGAGTGSGRGGGGGSGGVGGVPGSLPVRNGLRPGDVGYDGYDPHLFDGVWDEEAEGAEGAGMGTGLQGQGHGRG